MPVDLGLRIISSDYYYCPVLLLKLASHSLQSTFGTSNHDQLAPNQAAASIHNEGKYILPSESESEISGNDNPNFLVKIVDEMSTYRTFNLHSNLCHICFLM